MRIVHLGIVVFLLLPTFTTVAKTAEQEAIKNYLNANNQPVHQFAPSTETKLENSSQHPIKLYPEKTYKTIVESSTTSPVKKTSKQNYDSAQSVTSLKLKENSEEAISSSYLYVNTTYCNACRQNQASTRLYLEYNGSTYNLTFEITPYFRIDDEEPPGTYYVPHTAYLSRRGEGSISLGSSWAGKTYSFTTNNVGGYLGIYSGTYRLDTSSSYGYHINAVYLQIFVVDTKDPIVVDYPEDIRFPFDGVEDFELNWTATDSFPKSYYITQNGTFLEYGTFHSNQTISYHGLGSQLSLGVNEFTITFLDTSLNTVSHTAYVIVRDITPPVFEHPNNLVYPIGAIGNRLTWKPIDISTPGSYTLFSPAGVTSGTWNNDDEITVNVDGLPIGVYNYTIIIRDFYGNFGKDTILVTIYDLSPPEVTPVDSLTIEHGVLEDNISWTPIDSNPSHYTLKKDGIIIVKNQHWVSGERVEVSLNDLPVGITSYEIIFYDINGWSVSDTVTVNVVDTTSPKITQELPQTVEQDIILYNPQFYYINWLLTDLNPIVYTITVNDSFLQSASWQDGDEVVHFLSETELGAYNYTIIARDLYGNTAQQSVGVIVQDTLAPTVSNLADKTYDYGNYNHSFSWVVTDGQPAWYDITTNDTLLQEGIWDSDHAIEFTSIKPEFGSYKFALQVWDSSGNFASDSFILRIIDSDTPTIISPGSQSFKLWETQSIVWIATDLSGSGSYEISRNGAIVKTGSWMSDVSIDLQVQTNVTGIYNYEILVKDTVGTVAIDQITVTVFVTSSVSRLPGIANRTLEFGTTGEMLIWYPVSFNNGNYTVTWNGQLFDTNPYWLSNDPISISLDNLNLGDHVYNLTILDFSNTLAIDIVTVTVRDTIQPEVTTSPEIEFSIATNQRFIQWEAADWHPGNYQFMLGMQLIANDSWINNQEYALQLSNHGIGIYNYTLIVWDQFNNNLSQTITVTISDKLKPIINPVANNTYELGNEFPAIIWQIIDDVPNYFQIYKNDTLLHSDFWETGQIIPVNLTDLPVGIYNYTLLAYDQSRNVATASVFIRIEDTTSPVLEASDDLHLQVAQTGHAINWRVLDLQTGNYSLWKDGTLSQTGQWLSGEVLTFSVTAIATGTYTYTLQVADSSLNMANSSIFVFATDQLPPRISIIKTEHTLEYGSIGNELIWDVFEAGKWNYTIIRDKIQLNTLLSELLIEEEVEANQVITQTVDGLELGTYLYTLAIVDSAQNTASKTIVVNVVDTTKPALIEEPDIQAFNYKMSYNLNWSASDLLPGNYTILLDGTSVKSGVWENQDRINYTLTQFLLGEYNFTTIFSDGSGNSAYRTQIFRVEDKILPSIRFLGNTSYELNSTGYVLSWEVSDDFPEELIVVHDLYLSSNEISALNLSEIVTRFSRPINSDIKSLHELYQYFLTAEEEVLIHKRNYVNNVTTSQIAFKSAENISYTILVYDQSKNLNYMSVNITIIDTNIPEFTLTPSLTMDEPEFTWSATDLAPTEYEILINESRYETGIWDSIQEVKISLSTLEPGFYEVSIKIYDESRNHNSYQFSLIKAQMINSNPGEDNKAGTAQIFSSNKKVQYEMGSITNRVITWNRPQQSSHLNYELLENGKIIRASGVWPEELQLNFDLNSLPSGTHNFTLYVKDVVGDSYRNTTLVEIQDTTAPKIKLNHQNNTINSTSGNIVTIVELSDINPEMYYVYLNGSLMNSSNWKNGEIFVIDLNLQPGSYELLIIGYDSHTNSVTETVIITVYLDLLNNTQNNPSSIKIVMYQFWWLIIVAIAIAIIVVAMRKTSEKKIKKSN